MKSVSKHLIDNDNLLPDELVAKLLEWIVSAGNPDFLVPELKVLYDHLYTKVQDELSSADEVSLIAPTAGTRGLESTFEVRTPSGIVEFIKKEDGIYSKHKNMLKKLSNNDEASQLILNLSH